MLSHLGCVRPIVDPADPIGWPPKPAIIRMKMDPSDLIGWLFLKDQGNGERHRVQVLFHLGCVRPIIDPADLISWLFLTEPAIVRLIMDSTDLTGW